MSQPKIETVDDRDPRVYYTGAWVLGGVEEEHNLTTHGTYSGGSQVIFTFKGSSVEVFGTTSNIAPYTAAPVSLYSIDGSNPYTFSPPLPTGVSYQQSFYKSPPLDDKQHTLVITSTVSDSAFWLDYFEIVSDELLSPPPPPSPPPSLPLPSPTFTSQARSMSTSPELTTSSSSQSFSLSTPKASSGAPEIKPISLNSTLNAIPPSPSPSTSGDSSTTSAPTSALPTKNNTPLGAIVGGVIGGVVLILLACIFVLCYRRRQTGFHRVLTGIAFGKNPTPLSENLEGANTRFIGDVSPFTTHLTGHSNHASRSKADKVIFPSEPVILSGQTYHSYPIIASGKVQRMGRNQHSEQHLYYPEVPPQYS